MVFFTPAVSDTCRCLMRGYLEPAAQARLQGQQVSEMGHSAGRQAIAQKDKTVQEASQPPIAEGRPGKDFGAQMMIDDIGMRETEEYGGERETNEGADEK